MAGTDDTLAEQLARARYSRWVVSTGEWPSWGDLKPSPQAAWIRGAAADLAWLAARGRLVPEGARPEIEYATQWRNRAGTSTNTSEPMYRRDHAERRRREDEQVVQRQIIAGPWEPVPAPAQEAPDA